MNTFSPFDKEKKSEENVKGILNCNNDEKLTEFAPDYDDDALMVHWTSMS